MIEMVRDMNIEGSLDFRIFFFGVLAVSASVDSFSIPGMNFPKPKGIPLLKEVEDEFKLFMEFMQRFRKTYKDAFEQAKRFDIFKLNLKIVEKLNQKERGTAVYGVTMFSDITPEEFKSKLTADVTQVPLNLIRRSPGRTPGQGGRRPGGGGSRIPTPKSPRPPRIPTPGPGSSSSIPSSPHSPKPVLPPSPLSPKPTVPASTGPGSSSSIPPSPQSSKPVLPPSPLSPKPTVPAAPNPSKASSSGTKPAAPTLVIPPPHQPCRPPRKTGPGVSPKAEGPCGRPVGPPSPRPPAKDNPNFREPNPNERQGFSYMIFPYYPPVKDQGEDCFDCWAFAVTAALEILYSFFFRKPVSLSEQQILDCGNAGDCKGGNAFPAIEYALGTYLQLEKDYPYEVVKKECRYKKENGFLKLSEAIELLNEVEVAKCILGHGVPVVAIHGEPLQFYVSGVMDPVDCSKDTHNHVVNAVGFGTGKTGTGTPIDIWLMRNSWGVEWGKNGHFALRRGQNTCGMGKWGICTYASKASLFRPVK